MSQPGGGAEAQQPVQGEVIKPADVPTQGFGAVANRDAGAIPVPGVGEQTQVPKPDTSPSTPGMKERAADAARRAREVAGAATQKVQDFAGTEAGRKLIDVGLNTAEKKARERLEQRGQQASEQHARRIDKAKKGFWARLGPIGILKTVGLGILDAHSAVTAYSTGDILVAIAGFRDIAAAATQSVTDRPQAEIDALRKRGLLKIGAAAVPFVPGSLLAPVIDAATGVERNAPKPPPAKK